MKKYVVLLAVLVACAADAASFDCALAQSRIERAICASPTLSNLDSRLAGAYMAAQSNAVSLPPVVAEQRAWLREVRDKCTNEICLMQAYKDRIAMLNGRTASASASSPDATAIARDEAPENERPGIANATTGENRQSSYPDQHHSPTPVDLSSEVAAHRYLIDRAAALTADEVQSIDDQLAKMRKSDIAAAIVIVDDAGSDQLDDLGNQIIDKWEAAPAFPLPQFSISLSKARRLFSVCLPSGAGIPLPKTFWQSVIDETLTPSIRGNSIAQGLLNALQQIEAFTIKTKDEAVQAQTPAQAKAQTEQAAMAASAVQAESPAENQKNSSEGQREPAWQPKGIFDGWMIMPVVAVLVGVVAMFLLRRKSPLLPSTLGGSALAIVIISAWGLQGRISIPSVANSDANHAQDGTDESIGAPFDEIHRFVCKQRNGRLSNTETIRFLELVAEQQKLNTEAMNSNDIERTQRLAIQAAKALNTETCR